MIKLYYPREERPICFFNTDESAMYRLLLILLQRNRELDFDRVYADIIQMFGGDLKAFAEGKENMPDISELSEEEFSLERMLAIWNRSSMRSTWNFGGKGRQICLLRGFPVLS